jgi:hypothetical protein
MMAKFWLEAVSRAKSESNRSCKLEIKERAFSFPPFPFFLDATAACTVILLGQPSNIAAGQPAAAADQPTPAAASWQSRELTMDSSTSKRNQLDAFASLTADDAQMIVNSLTEEGPSQSSDQLHPLSDAVSEIARQKKTDSDQGDPLGVKNIDNAMETGPVALDVMPDSQGKILLNQRRLSTFYVHLTKR